MVSIHTVTPEAWAAKDQPFLMTVASRPLVTLAARGQPVTERNPSADDLGWLPDAPATGFLLDRGQIEHVEANPAHARTILAQARMHLSSARILATTEDAAAAFVTAYYAARKSLSAMLAVQGLRARDGDGGHRVLSELM
ncbi:MAG TPA: hypothetical protein VFQ68_03605 [Streptosporangiaceae bacterium]|nr:hypothetical protein [Streptosporangiaceae bacterium]